ncbi:uncharacterized protein KY384_006832 [Bacidia gigantensis]|uniref:uncharacterized protein n=1 Tax=Bacidia gigantensis TaxID=2732470 RepID=UPI001D0373C3|nr:uncharacterized protein KY384_006832 [Bacidia gigantensis]KAG8527916.1 hypothetical protein KY384_006832 [Bacidia gigantensis]
MAEFIAAVSLASSIAQLTDFSIKVVKRLNEFMRDVEGLPQCFQHMANQLPIMIGIVEKLHKRADKQEFSNETEERLKCLFGGLEKELKALDDLLGKIKPSAQASTWEKGLKAMKSLKAQRTVENYASTDQLDYVKAQTDQIMSLLSSSYDQKLAIQSMVPAMTRKPIWMLDFDPDEDFIGREDIMNEIEQRFQAMAKRVAVAGIGGIGKSRVAIEYCYQKRRQESPMDVFWVHGATRSKFETAYRKIARLLGLSCHDDNDVDVLQRVQDHLSENLDRPWVMVVDNADSHDQWLLYKQNDRKIPKVLIDYLPRCSHGRILITTRDSQLGYKLTEAKTNPIHIRRFGPQEACKLFKAKHPGSITLSNDDLSELTEALEYLPLTITQAAAYLNQIEMTASEYLSDFRAGSSDIPELLTESVDDPSRDRETSNSVFQTWRLSFEQISKQSPRAAEILSMMAMLDRQEIFQDLLRKDDESLIQFKGAISKLKAFSFIKEVGKPPKFSMHRLVQLSTQRWMEARGELKVYEEKALATVSSVCPISADYEDWAAFSELKPHINAVLEYKVNARQALIDRARILHGFGHYLMLQGQESAASELLEEAWAIRREHLGYDHEATLTTMGVLGVSYSMRGKDFWRKAQDIQLHVLDLSRRTLGENHRLALKSESRLAITYNKEGKHQRSKELHVQILQKMKTILGEDDLDTLKEMSCLMFIFNRLKQWREAEDVGLVAYRLRSKVLGETHPDTVTIMAQLCIVYNAQRRWEEAARLERKVLQLRLDTLGAEHPKSLSSMESLARSLVYQKGQSEADSLLSHVLDVRTRMLGPQHRLTYTVSSQLKRLRQTGQLRAIRPPPSSSSSFGGRPGHSLGGSAESIPTISLVESREDTQGQLDDGRQGGQEAPNPGSASLHQHGDGVSGHQQRQTWGSSPPPPYTERALSNNWRGRSGSRSPRPGHNQH